MSRYSDSLRLLLISPTGTFSCLFDEPDDIAEVIVLRFHLRFE